MKKINLAIIGAGFTSQTCHIPNYFNNHKVRIVALAEKKEKLRKVISKKYNIKYTFSNHNTLLDTQKNLDGVVVIVKRNQIYDVVKDCLKKKVNVFSEKPMCKTLSQAKRLLKISKNKKVIYKIGYNKIYDQGVIKGEKTFNKICKSGKFGKFLYFKFHRFSGTGYEKNIKFIDTKENYIEKNKNNSNFPNFLKNKHYKLYDTYLNLYSHNINLLNYFFKKQPKIKSFYSKNGHQLVVFDYKNFYGTLETKFKKDYEWDEELNFYFENGKITIKTYPQQIKNKPAMVIVKKREKKEKLVKIQRLSWSFKNQSLAFVNDLIRNKCNINSAQECIKDIKIIENIFYKL